MQVVTLEISDDYYDKFLHVVDALPIEKVSLKKIDFRKELTNRLEDIDTRKEELTPYMSGMDEMLQRVKMKYANS